ncbi:TetR/AcrR family transcriptional regulator, partial [Streptomyces sp. SID335]|nr:TetR/AcrR family transcriptional regulator [Streptomyces sp. SID335]
PAPSRAAGSTSSVPAQRRADAGVPSSGELLALVRDRTVLALGGRGRVRDPDLARACESAVRLALSYVVAPAGNDDDPAELVRGAIGRWVAAK